MAEQIWRKRNIKKKEKNAMLQVSYPQATGYQTLSKIITIETDNEFDFILLGDSQSGTLLGYITESKNGFLFSSEIDNQRQYPFTQTYEGALLHAFIDIANDPALTHELAVLSSRKSMADNELF